MHVKIGSDNWDFRPLKERLLATSEDPDRVEAVIGEYQKYMSIVASDPTTTYGLIGPVDDCWHEHIEMHEDYAEFCEKFFGGYLTHEKDVGEDRHALYQRTLAALGEEFGGADPEIWISKRDGEAGCGNGSVTRTVMKKRPA